MLQLLERSAVTRVRLLTALVMIKIVSKFVHTQLPSAVPSEGENYDTNDMAYM